MPLGEPCVASLRRAMGTRRRRGDDAPLWAARDVNDAGAGYACGVTIAIRVMRSMPPRCPAICATIGGYDKRTACCSKREL